jgi:hypothetical protein
MTVWSDFDLTLIKKETTARLPINQKKYLYDILLVMATEQILALLIAERDRLNRAIEALSGPTKRRGRPPKKSVYDDPSMPDWVKPTSAKKKTARKGRTFTAAQKKAQAERMKKMWQERKKTAATKKS